MSRVQAAHMRALWEKRKQETDAGLVITNEPPRDRPRDRWILRMLGRSALHADLTHAAHRYADSLEQSELRASSSIGERVGGGRADPHATMARVCDAARIAREARAYVVAHCRVEQVDAFDQAFAVPHKSMAQVCRALDAHHVTVTRRLTKALERLADFFDIADEQKLQAA